MIRDLFTNEEREAYDQLELRDEPLPEQRDPQQDELPL